MTINLKKLEQRLAREAITFRTTKPDGKTGSAQRMWKICGLTGLAPTQDGFHAKALKVLRHMLAAQRRWARMAHPAYDLNRHLTLREALVALENEGNVTSEMKGPEILSDIRP